MLHQHVILAMYGNEEFWAHQIVHELQFLTAGMAGHVDALVAAIDDVSPQLHEIVDGPGHQFLIARNGGSRNDDRITGHHRHLAMVGHGHTGQCRHRLALAAGSADDNLVRTEAIDFINVDNGPLRRVDIAQLHGDAHHVHHAAAQYGHPALIAHGGVDDLLDAMDIGGEGGHDDAALGPVESLVKGSPHRALAHGVAFALSVGAVCHHHQHALVAQLCEAAEVCHLAIYRRIIQLEVTGMDNHAHGSLDGEAYGIRNGMIDTDEAHAETTNVDDVPLHDRMQVAGVHPIFLKTPLQDAQGQAGTIHRHIDLLQQVRQGADMVLMAVSQHHSLDHIPVLDEVGDIRDNEIYPQHILLREHEAGIDDQNLIIYTNNGHVLADFPKSAQGNDL